MEENPMIKYNEEEIRNMSDKDYIALLQDYDDYIRSKYSGPEGYNKLKEEYPRWEEEVVINGSRVFVENGDVKTILSNEINRRGWMSVGESFLLTMISVLKIYQMNNGKMK